MGLLGKRRGKVAKGVGQPAASGSDLIGGSLSKDDHYYIVEAFGISGSPGGPTPSPIDASGGTKVISPTIVQHFFTSPGNFVISSGSGDVEYLIVAGGGSGGGANGSVVASGGGGAGGLISSFPEGPGGPSPNSAASVPIGAGTYAVVVGAGGVGGPTSPDPEYGQDGSNSSIAFPSTLTATGGGEGGKYNVPAGSPGGSGGGGGYISGTSNGGSGTAGQGYPGGTGVGGAEGGGGGAGGAGLNAGFDPPGTDGGTGGIGKGFASIPPSYGTPGPSPTLRYFAGGGGGGAEATMTPSVKGEGGYGGGGAGGERESGDVLGTPGTANTGGGGGGGQNSSKVPSIASGGSGIVVIRYPV